VRKPKSNDRTARWLTLAREPSTFETICTAQASGKGAVAWCKERDVRYMDVMRWIDDDPTRAFSFELATKARGAQTVQQLESVTRMAIAGAVDPRAAAVASKNMQWLAGVYDRKRYGEQMRVDHKHGFSADHLAALKALASPAGETLAVVSESRNGVNGFQSAPHSVPALTRDARATPLPIDAEFRQVADCAETRNAAREVLDDVERLGI
jgi:hypothetical protein